MSTVMALPLSVQHCLLEAELKSCCRDWWQAAVCPYPLWFVSCYIPRIKTAASYDWDAEILTRRSCDLRTMWFKTEKKKTSLGRKRRQQICKEGENCEYLLLAVHILAASSVGSHCAGRTRSTWSGLLRLSVQRENRTQCQFVWNLKGLRWKTWSPPPPLLNTATDFTACN